MLEQTERMEFAELACKLQEAGYKQVSFQMMHTRMRVTGIRADQTEYRRDASDKVYLAEAVKEGKRGRVYWTQIPHSEELFRQLEENIEFLGEQYEAPVRTEAVEKCREISKIKEKEFLWEDHDDVSMRLLQASEASCQAPYVSFVKSLSYEQHCTEICVLEADGNEYTDTTGYHCLKVEVTARQDGEVSHAKACRYGRVLEETYPKELAGETAKEAAAGLGGKMAVSGYYPVILKNVVMAEILEAYLPAFYADRILNQRSPIAGCEGKQVAASDISIREVPMIKGGRVQRTIDDEGNPVQEKYLIRNGLFQTELLNQKFSARMNRRCTGNGFKESPKSEVGIGVTNILLESDTHGGSLEELKKKIGRGILVTDVDGVFAGTDVMTGAFSLIAKGRKVEEGKDVGPFCQVTIAGNFFDLLRQIRSVGDDYASTSPECASVLAPSVYVGELAVSGR